MLNTPENENDDLEQTIREATVGGMLAEHRKYPAVKGLNSARLNALGMYLFLQVKNGDEDNIGKTIGRVLKAAFHLRK